jgi:flagellar hook-associated protein 1 FlgK
MPGIFGIFEIGRRALAAQQIGMNVTSHNIANASTVGYSRQRTDFVAGMALQNAQGFFLGTGVDVQSITRMRDRFLDTQYRQANSSLGNASMRSGVLSQIEASLQEPSDSGLQALMAGFFNSFQELAAHPEESAPRNAVLMQATRLASTFNRLSTNFTTQRANIAEDVGNKIAQINRLTQQIGQLNQQILTAQGGGNQSADLRDQRDAALDELSRIADVSASVDGQGILYVSIGGTIVAGNGTSTALQSNVVNGSLKITNAVGQDVNLNGGELGSMLEMYNTTIPGYMSQLDQLATTIIRRVNTVHAAGYGLGNPPPTGIDFFTGTDASTIAVSSQISTNINNIAASADGSPGNNANALALYGIFNEQLMDAGTTTVTQYYSRFVSTIGTAVSAANADSNGATAVLSQVDAQRESISGVSLDEEMTNMIRFQRSYEAAARVISAADELMKTILNLV